MPLPVPALRSILQRIRIQQPRLPSGLTAVNWLQFHPPSFARLHRAMVSPLGAAGSSSRDAPNAADDYTTWTHPQLISRIRALESSLTTATATATAKPPVPTPKKRRTFDLTRYTTRLIALKLAYLGASYNGFEYHPNNPTPLPTVEEKLFEALLKSRLVAPGEETPGGGFVTSWPVRKSARSVCFVGMRGMEIDAAIILSIAARGRGV